MAWSESQQLTLALVPKFSALLSLAGSVWILVEVLTEGRKIRNVYNRLLAMMAIYDIIESCFNFASTWPIPKGTENVWMPSGTTSTCVAQGFFLQFSLGVPLYNACLSLYYLLIIRYGVSEERIQKRIEPAMHGIVFLVAGGTAFSAVALNLFNNANLWCWIAPLPLDCKDSLRYPADEANCERGDNAWLYRWLFYFIPLWICIAISIVATFMFYCSVKKREAATFHYRHPSVSRVSRGHSSFSEHHRTMEMSNNLGNVSNQLGAESEAQPAQQEDDGEGVSPNSMNNDSSIGGSSNRRASMTRRASSSILGIGRELRRRMSVRSSIANDPTHNPRSKEVLQQAAFFTFGFWVTHLFSTLNRTIQLVRGDTFFIFIVLHSWFDPLQGFTNFVVYRRPRYSRYRKRNPNVSRWRALCYTLRWSFMGPPTPKKEKGDAEIVIGRTVTQATPPQQNQEPQQGRVVEYDDEEPSEHDERGASLPNENPMLDSMPDLNLQRIEEERLEELLSAAMTLTPTIKSSSSSSLEEKEEEDVLLTTTSMERSSPTTTSHPTSDTHEHQLEGTTPKTDAAEVAISD